MKSQWQDETISSSIATHSLRLRTGSGGQIKNPSFNFSAILVLDSRFLWNYILTSLHNQAILNVHLVEWNLNLQRPIRKSHGVANSQTRLSDWTEQNWTEKEKISDSLEKRNKYGERWIDSAFGWNLPKTNPETRIWAQVVYWQVIPGICSTAY